MSKAPWTDQRWAALNEWLSKVDGVLSDWDSTKRLIGT